MSKSEMFRKAIQSGEFSEAIVFSSQPAPPKFAVRNKDTGEQIGRLYYTRRAALAVAQANDYVTKEI